MAYALTTVDNPFDPFEQFDLWLNFDLLKGYNCSALLTRVARTSEFLSEEENDKEIERAIDEIIKYDFTNTFKKVSQKTTD